MRKAVILVLFKLPVLSGFSFPPVFLKWSKQALLGRGRKREASTAILLEQPALPNIPRAPAEIGR